MAKLEIKREDPPVLPPPGSVALVARVGSGAYGIGVGCRIDGLGNKYHVLRYACNDRGSLATGRLGGLTAVTPAQIREFAKALLEMVGEE